MWGYIICVGIWVCIFGSLTHAIRTHNACEIYAHCGLGLFFTSLVLGLSKMGTLSAILWLQIVGFVLYLPAALLVISSRIALNRRGKLKTTLDTATMVNSGVYRIVRHPMQLGMVIWAIGLMLTFQSAPCIILGIAAVFCFWMASKKEDEFNIKKFGGEYEKYMEEVSMWNVFRGLKRVVNKK